MFDFNDYKGVRVFVGFCPLCGQAIEKSARCRWEWDFRFWHWIFYKERGK